MHKEKTIDTDGDRESMLPLMDSDGNLIPDLPGEGMMLVRCTKEGLIIPHVLRLGIMTGGRLEMGFMIMVNAIDQAHGAENRRRNMAERAAARLMRETKNV